MAQPFDPHEPPPRLDVSDTPDSQGAGFAASAPLQRRSVISALAMASDPPEQYSYAVRSVYREDRTEDGKPLRMFKERIVLVRAETFEEALAKGQAEAEGYVASSQHAVLLDHTVAYNIHGDDHLQDQDEVWSCIRGLDLSDEAFLRRIYDGEFENLTNAFLRRTDG